MLGKRITLLRTEKNLSIEELSIEIDIDSNIIKKWEQGYLNPKIDELIKLSDFFDISTDFLLEKTNERNFTYYHREEKKVRKLQLYHLISLVFIMLSILTIIAFVMVSLLEPKIYYDLATNTNYEGIVAYWKAYIEVKVGLIISIITLAISLTIFFLPRKLIKYFLK